MRRMGEEMKTFRLIEKIEGKRLLHAEDHEIGLTCIAKTKTKLIVDDNYEIIRYEDDNGCVYCHYKNNELVKVCVYGE